MIRFSLTVAALFLAAALCFGFSPPSVRAENGNGLPDAVTASLTAMIERVQDHGSVDIADVAPLLLFARDTALTRDDWDLPGLLNATGGYHGYEIAAPVDRIVEHIYHPELPPSIFHPSVVRVGKWTAEPEQMDIPLLWNDLGENQVVVVHGQGLEENTPDVNTGGYYTYRTHRMIVLINHEGEKYLLSVSKQADQSSVGRKGVVIGDDRDWNYFYTDEEGLTASGLGWVNSYMFDSFSVTVLMADPAAPDRARHAMFKWVRAGWSGMNMVRPSHVRNGCQRYAQSLVRLMESDKLPHLDALVAMSRRVRAMGEQEVLLSLHSYIENLRKISSEDSVLSRRSFQQLLARDNPLEHYSLYAKQSLLMKELLKASIGAPALLAVDQDEVLVSLLR